MQDFGKLQSIELKEGFLTQYFAGKGLSSNPDQLNYRIRFNNGIPMSALLWCVNSCQYKWGWLFINVDPKKTIPHCDEAYMLFEDETDALLFKLQHV